MGAQSPRATDRAPDTALRAAWHDLLTAARDAGYAIGELVNAPATPDLVAEAEQGIGRRLPDGLAGLYLLADGQVDWLSLVGDRQRGRGRWVGSLFGAGWSFDPLQHLQSGYQGWADVRDGYTADELATDFDEAVEVRGDDPVKKRYSSPDWIPFATDGGGNSLAVDLDPAPGGTVGQVIVIGPDEDLRRVIAPSVLELLRLCARQLRAQTGEPDVDEGVWLYTLEAPSTPGDRTA